MRFVIISSGNPLHDSATFALYLDHICPLSHQLPRRGLLVDENGQLEIFSVRSNSLRAAFAHRRDCRVARSSAIIPRCGNVLCAALKTAFEASILSNGLLCPLQRRMTVQPDPHEALQMRGPAMQLRGRGTMWEVRR